MTASQEIIKLLKAQADPERQQHSQRFFKTGPGEYGEGDTFLGLTVPQIRAAAKQYYKQATIADIEVLLTSKIHDFRLVGLILMTYQFPKQSQNGQAELFGLYLSHTDRINNWDLVDLSAPNIIGEYMLVTKLDLPLLQRLAQSKLLWERRIAIISTLAFIRAVKKQQVPREWLEPSLKLAEQLLGDQHDLIHKAVGWTLREVGKVDELLLRRFLDDHLRALPRTALRYAIERLPEADRKTYLVR